MSGHHSHHEGSNGRRGRGERRGRPAAGRAARSLVAACVLALAGCGIRPTSVPVDAGAAPSRIACVLPGAAQPAPDPQDTVVRVHLVCGSRVSAVQRSVPLPEGRVAVAGALLDTLAAKPSETERAAGFATRVPDDLEVSAGGPADPPGTLRLSMPPAELPEFALAQVVCTLAESEAAVKAGSARGRGDAVVLAGPDTAAPLPPRRLTCTSALRNRAEAARTAGVPVRP